MKRLVSAVSVSAAILTLSGCANMVEIKKNVDVDHKVLEARTSAGLAQITERTTPANGMAYSTASKSSYSGIIKQVQRDGGPLPAIFQSDITLIFPDRPNISTVAERLTKTTGIPVRLRPDVFISATAFLPKSVSLPPAGAGPATPPPGQAPAVLNPTATTPAGDFSVEIPLNYTGKLEGFLDSVSAKTGLNWQYKDNGITFSRMVTKTFVLKNVPGTSESKASVGKSGGTSVGTGSTFSADSNIKMGSSFSVWDNVRESVSSMLTGVGKVAVTEATGTITVTDTRDVVDQVGVMIAQINKTLGKQVSFKVEVLSVSTSDTSNYGVDWSAVINKFIAANPSWKLGFASPASLVPNGAASLGYQILTPAGQPNNRSAITGTQGMLTALNQFGQAHYVTTASAITLNRQPVPVAITEQVSYVQSVAVTPSTTSGVAATVAVTPGVVTTGFILNLLPAVTEENNIELQMSVDISVLKSLATFGSGQSAVQQPQISGTQFLQRIGIRNGETLVLSGFERKAGQYDRRGLTKDSDLLMGGSLTGSQTKESIIILLTPFVSDGV